MKQKVYILVTVDTENPQVALVKGNYREDTILKSGGSENHGIKRIMGICDRFGVKATFYLDIYEKYHLGDRLFEQLCRAVLDRGHEIQLHTHPVWMMDREERKRVNMYQYSYEEQCEIIGRGRDDLKAMTGKYPIAHRAGSYGLNRDTLRALKNCGMEIDSSYFKDCPNCKISGGGRYYNKIHRQGGLLELPVSVYGRRDFRLLSPLGKKDMELIKTDINYSTENEMRGFYREAQKDGVRLCYMNLFMHSFSFYRMFYTDIREKGRVDFTPALETERRFMRLLQYLSRQEDAEFVTVSEFYRIYRENSGMIERHNRDFVPEFHRIRL